MTHAIEAGTNPLEDLIRAELATATLAQLDHQAARLWKEHAAGRLDDEAIGRLSEEIHALKVGRRALRPAATVSLGDAVKAHQAVLAGQAAPSAATKPAWVRSIFPPKKPSQRSPDRAKSRERARTLAASSGLPPTIACQFTAGEQSVLFIVAAECHARGLCDRCHDELAARAGVSVSTVKRALRLAKHLQLVRIEERPQKGAKNLPNVVRIISREWAAWIGKRKPTGGSAIGGQKRPATEKEDFRKGFSKEQRPTFGPRRPVKPRCLPSGRSRPEAEQTPAANVVASSPVAQPLLPMRLSHASPSQLAQKQVFPEKEEVLWSPLEATLKRLRRKINL